MNNQSTTTSKSYVGAAAAFAFVTALAPLGLDTFLPAFPVMAQSLSVSVHELSLSISVYVFMLASGQLVGGPLSDRWGRAPVMMLGLIVFALSGMTIAMAQNLEQILILRALQAFGGGATTVCIPAIIRDRLSGREAAKFFSLIGLIMILAPALAPSIGAMMLSVFDWPAIFIMLGGYGVCALAVTRWIIFKSPQTQSARPSSVSTWHRYKAVLSIRPALRYMLLQASGFAMLMLFVTHASFIYQENFSASPSLFALLLCANVVVMMASNLFNQRLLRKRSSESIIRLSVTVQAVAICALLLVVVFAPKLWLFVPALALAIGVMGAFMPNNQACYMEFFHEHGGTASALMGAFQFLTAGLISAASVLMPETLLAIVGAQAVCVAISVALALGIKVPQQNP